MNILVILIFLKVGYIIDFKIIFLMVVNMLKLQKPIIKNQN